jgi:hypothetical protein
VFCDEVPRYAEVHSDGGPRNVCTEARRRRSSWAKSVVVFARSPYVIDAVGPSASRVMDETSVP